MDRDAPAQVWVGKGVPSEWLQSVLQLPSLEGVDTARLRIPLLETETSVRVNRLINAVRSQRPHLMQMPMLMLPLMEWKESQAADHVLASLELHPSTLSLQFRLPMMHAHPLVPVVHPRLLVALWLVSPQQQCSVEAHVERVFPR
jgi:hypothetical protein